MPFYILTSGRPGKAEKMKFKKPKDWRKGLTKVECLHLSETIDGRVTKGKFINNLRHQKEKDCKCFECSHIAKKLGITIMNMKK